MKKLFKVNLLALAMLCAVGTTFAFKAEQLKTTEKWAYDGASWHNVDGQTQQPPAGGPGDYRCNSAEVMPTCTAEFPISIDPNDDDSQATNVILGNYVEL